jgi:signal transduction histidine kinase
LSEPRAEPRPLTLLNRSLLATTVLAAMIMAAAFWLGSRSSSDDAWVIHSLDMRAQLTRVLSLVQSAETGQRGYLLTGRDLYLLPYRTAVEELPATLDRIRDMVRDDPAQLQPLARLRELIGAKLDELRAALDTYRTSHNNATLAIVDSDNGYRLMQQIRDQIAAMQATEDIVLVNRQSAAERSAALLQVGVAIAFLLICGMGLLIARFTRESFAVLTAANDRLVEQVTRREAAESELRQAQKMDALGQLTGGIAHDFNNMLGVIMGANDLVSRRIQKGDFDIQRFLNVATSATERAAMLTQRLLAFARRQPLSPEPLDANKMIVSMSELLHSTLGEHIKIETVAAAGLWTVHADSQQLENAIINIAINARDAMPDGGKMTIETANAVLDESDCRQNPEITPGQFVVIAIADTGVGMTPEVAARAFDPFFTTKAVGRGTGLGLSQVYGFVKQSHGLIKVDSELGAGTTVRIYLPRLTGDAHDIQRDSPESARAGARNEVILVVEDDALMRRLTADALQELGYTVFEADSGANALTTLDRAADVKLLFTDVVMPDMNGKKLADEAKRRRSSLKVIFTTGYPANVVVQSSAGPGGTPNVLLKPFTLDQLAAKVRGVLDA